LNNENITITTIKRAEDSEDMVIRMYDGQGTDISVDLTSFFKIDNLKQMNIIEENAEPVTSMNVSKYGIETFSFGVKR